MGERARIAFARLLKPPGGLELHAQVEMRRAVFGVRVDSVAEAGDGLLGPPQRDACDAEIAARIGEIGSERGGPAKAFGGLLVLPERAEGGAEIVVHQRVMGLGRERLAIERLGRRRPAGLMMGERLREGVGWCHLPGPGKGRPPAAQPVPRGGPSRGPVHGIRAGAWPAWRDFRTSGMAAITGDGYVGVLGG